MHENFSKRLTNHSETLFECEDNKQKKNKPSHLTLDRNSIFSYLRSDKHTDKILIYFFLFFINFYKSVFIAPYFIAFAVMGC